LNETTNALTFSRKACIDDDPSCGTRRRRAKHAPVFMNEG
jgi:hypothetical protein